ncbi:MAG: DEAD/DEAH box helicase family protein [Candidatus Hadarchaeales archaeon]
MKKVASSLVILFLLKVPAVLATTVSIHLSDYAVNPGQVIEVWGSVENGGSPLENRLVTISLDGSPVSFSWTQPAWEGVLENLQITGGVLKLSYRADYDLAYIDENGYLSTVDVDGNVRNLGILASRVGAMIDADGDGDQDLFYLADNGYICSVDNSANVHTYPRTATDIGGVCDFDGNGSLDILYVYNNYPYYVPLAGGTPTQLLSLTTGRIGFCGRFLPGIERIYAPITLPDASGIGWVATGGYWGWTGAGGTPLDVGAIADFDGDGTDNDLLFASTGGLGYFDNNIVKIWISAASGAKGVGGVIDWDVDGDLDAVFMASDNTVKLVDKSGNLINLGVKARDVGGIVDFDNDTGYRISGRYTCVKDWGTPHFRPENMTVSVSIPLAGASISVLVELSDNQDFSLVKENCSFTLSSSGTTTQIFSFENLCRYTRLTFTFHTPSKANTPSLNSFTLRSRVYTDNEGGYSFHIRAPTLLGEHWIGVEVEDNENSSPFDVRRLVFDNFLLLDNHGQLDNILNPGENYRLTVRIREDNSSQFYEVTSGSFTLRLGGENYPLEHWENSIWRTQASFTAPTSLGSYNINVENIWGYSGENIIGSTSATYTYQVKTIQVPINFRKRYTGAQPWYNPGENFQIYGTLTLRPDGTPVGGVTVQIYENTGTGWEYRGENQADSAGNYSFTLTAPSTLGPKQIRVATSENGIEGENIRTYYVKTLTLTVELDKYSVQPGQRVTASGVAILRPDNENVRGQQVKLEVLDENFNYLPDPIENSAYTADNGWYYIGFNAPPNAGEFWVRVRMCTYPEEIVGENCCEMRSEALRITIEIRNDADARFRPGDSIMVGGEAWFEPSGDPAPNHLVQLWRTGREAQPDNTWTDENGRWSSEFSAPSTWGEYEVRVRIENSGLVGTARIPYKVSIIGVTLSFRDSTPEDDQTPGAEKIMNPGEGVTISLAARLLPDLTPIDNGSVYFSLAGSSYDNVGYTDNQGRLEYAFNGPRELGRWEVKMKVVKGIGGQAYTGENSDILLVRKLQIEAYLDKYHTTGNQLVNINGTAQIENGTSRWPLSRTRVRAYIFPENATFTYTDENGVFPDPSFPLSLISPDRAGAYEVKVWAMDENGIRGENVQILYVETIILEVELDDTVVMPGQRVKVKGKAYFENSREPVFNPVLIFLDRTHIATAFHPDNEEYENIIQIPLNIQLRTEHHTITVYVENEQAGIKFSRENSVPLIVRELRLVLDESIRKDPLPVMVGKSIEIKGKVTVQPEGWPVSDDTPVNIRWFGSDFCPRTFNGEFSQWLDAPSYPIYHENGLLIYVVDENGISLPENKSKIIRVSVRRLEVSYLGLIDSHQEDGENDTVLNPRENYQIILGIVEWDGKYQITATSSSDDRFRIFFEGAGPYTLRYDSDKKWYYTEKVFTAEENLGEITHTITFTGTSVNGITVEGGAKDLTISYWIKFISIQLQFDNIVNPGDNVLISGHVTMLPKPEESWKINSSIRIWWQEGGERREASSEIGDSYDFSFTWRAPPDLGRYEIFFKATADGEGIESENSCKIWVKTIGIELEVDQQAYTQDDNVKLTVKVTLLPDGLPIPGIEVRLFGDGLDNETRRQTSDDGSFTYIFPVSENAKKGTGRIYAWTKNADDIIGENSIEYYVGQPIQIGGILRNVENVPLQPILKFKSLTTEGLVIEIATGSNGKYGKYLDPKKGVLVKGIYDFYIKGQNFTVILHELDFLNVRDWENFENIIRLDNFSPSAASVSATRAKFISFAIETSENLKGRFSGVTVIFDYSGFLDQVINEDKLAVFRSADWNFNARSGSFSQLSASIDKINHTVTVHTSGLSAYVLAETTYSFEELSSQLQSAAGGVSSAASSLQGAAARMEGAVARFENIVAQMSLGELVISDPASIFLELQQGENLSFRISLRNRTTTPMTLTPRIAGDLVGILTVKENSVQLGSLSGGSLNLHVEVPPTQPIGNVNGSVVLDGKIGNYTLPSLREIPVNLKVVPPEKSLLDLRLSPVQTSVKPGSVASISLNMLNIGKLPWVDAQLVLRIIGPDGKVISTRIENLSFETALSKIFDFKLPSNLPEGDYRVEAEAQYRCNGRTYSASSITGFELRSEAPKEISLFGMAMSSIFAALATGGLAAGTGVLIYRWERSRMKVKRRFEHLVAFAELPPAEDSAWMGHLAETKRRAFIKFDDLMTHMIIAGATGSGKTIAAMDIAEEALLNKKNVIVVDPTAQWTGFLRKCREEKMIKYFSKFGISQDQAHGFPGRIIQVVDPNMKVDVSRMIRDPNGRIYIFVVERLRPEQLDLFIQNLIQSVFDARLEESPKLRALLIFDEVHRLLPRFGGAGKGIVQLERGVREFRKWGVGMVLVSQVVSDFEREIRANIRNQIQLWTRDEEELARITEKFGAEYMRSISRASVGHGMYFNPDYNKGKPYFINFRPILHQVSRMSVEELDRYTSASARVDAVRQKIEALEKIGVDTFEQRTELELTERKLEEGAFDMVDFYLESLEPSVDRLLERHGLKGVLEAKPAEQAPEQPPAEKPAEVPVLESYKQAVAPMLKGGRTRRGSKGARR